MKDCVVRIPQGLMDSCDTLISDPRWMFAGTYEDVKEFIVETLRLRVNDIKKETRAY